MNESRRTRIAAIMNDIDGAKNMLEEILQEEEEAFDNLPESLQGSEKGETMQEAINTLQDALSDLDSAISNMEGVSA
jgi:uncharacterized protein YukE